MGIAKTSGQSRAPRYTFSVALNKDPDYFIVIAVALGLSLTVDCKPQEGKSDASRFPAPCTHPLDSSRVNEMLLPLHLMRVLSTYSIHSAYCIMHACIHHILSLHIVCLTLKYYGVRFSWDTIWKGERMGTKQAFLSRRKEMV